MQNSSAKEAASLPRRVMQRNRHQESDMQPNPLILSTRLRRKSTQESRDKRQLTSMKKPQVDKKSTDKAKLVETSETVCPNHKCNKTFVTKRSLVKHMRYDCQMKPRYRCAICKYSSTHRFQINKHCESSHKGKKGLVIDTLKQS